MKKLLILSFLLLMLPLFSEISLNHIQPVYTENNRRPTLDLEIREGFLEIEKVKIFFRQTGEAAYSEKEMEAGSESNPKYSSIMSEFASYSSNTEYYFEVQTTTGNLITYPSIQPEINPFRFTNNTPYDKNDGFVLLSPDAVYSDVAENFLVAVSIFALSEEIDYNSIKVFFDGEDVTSKSNIFTNTITYQVFKAKPGEHTYSIEAKLLDGSSVGSEQWTTNIKSINYELPLNISGRALFSMRYLNTSHDSIDNDLDKSANFLLSFDGYSKWLKFNSKIYLSSLETSSDQAVNRYSFGFKVPHFNLTLGDYAPVMNSFVLNGKNIMGVHTKLNFKSFRVLYTFGNIERKIDGKVIEDDSGMDYLEKPGTFKQTNNSFRLELGNPQSFTMGFGFAKNKDIISSLDEQYYRNLDDSLLIVNPKDNLVLGTDFRFALLNQRLVLGTEAAMSLYNDNIIDGAISLDDFEEDVDFPFDPHDFENIFVINESMVPYKPGMANIAIKSNLRLFFYRNLLNISVTNIGSSFNSLSTNYLQKDAKVITINDNLMLLNNKLALNIGYNIASDNVDNTKDKTSTSSALFSQVMYKPNDEIYFNLNFNTSSSEDGFESAEGDTMNTAVDVRSTIVSFGSGYLVEQITNAPTRFAVNFSNTVNKDDANDSFEYQRNNIILSAKTSFEQLPLTTLLSYTLTLNDNSTSQDALNISEKSNYNSIFIRGEFELLESRLKPFADFRFNQFKGDIDSQAAQMFNIGTSYDISANTFVSAAAGLKMYQNSEISDADYSRLNFKMKISQRF